MGFELLLPVVLFILTLTIIFLLRSDDKRNQRADLIKKRAQALLKNVENSQILFKESAQKAEERISKKIDESHLLMSHVDSQLTDLEARSDDLASLQKVLATYQTSLTQLESATTQVENRVGVMKTEIANLNRVQESLSDFDVRFEQFKESLEKQIAEGEENMHLQQLRIKEMQGSSFAKLQEYENEVHRVGQEALIQVRTHTETLKDRQDASLELVSVQMTKLRQLSEKGDEQLLLYDKALQSGHKQADEKVEELQKKFLQLQANHIEQQKRQKEELFSIEENMLSQITEEMQNFVRQCYGEMAQIFEMTLKKTDISFQNMIRVVSQYLKELSSRIEQARGVAELLGASEHTSLLSFKEDLNLLLEATLKGEQNLAALQNLEGEASSALALLQQESQQLQESLTTMKEEKLALLTKSGSPPLSVVYAMALVDETCHPQREDSPSSEEASIEPPAEDPLSEGLHQKTEILTFPKRVDLAPPSVVYAMALVDETCNPQEKEPVEPPTKKVSAKSLGRESKKTKTEKDTVPDKEKQASVESRRVEYLSESEEEILLDEDEDLPD